MKMSRTVESMRLSGFIAALSLMAGFSPVSDAALLTDLSLTPPDLTASVDPNLVVTFDDSGSMAWNYMGDSRPYDNGGWGTDGPWSCAGVIDPTIDLGALGASATLEQQAKARSMNGVYYNPNVVYSPPLYKDGSAFPVADATLQKVWLDGISINRPAGNTPAATATVRNNRNSNSRANDTALADLTGKLLAIPKTSRSRYCPTEADSGSCSSTNCSGSGSSRRCDWSYTVSTDERWSCAASDNKNPFDGTKVATFPDGTTGTPNGGPYYYRFNGTLSVDATTGKPNVFDATAANSLYNPSNWEAVPVPVDQYQNFANWYAYYRTRGIMARTALSRVFGSLGENVRVAWQALGNNNSEAWGATVTKDSTIITNLTDTNITGDSAADNYRTDFFNWVYRVGSISGTPNREAMKRASNFFSGGSPTTKNLKNPYYLAGGGVDGKGTELSCRQNFHMLLTDGFWNGGAGSPAPSKLATASTTFYQDDSTTPPTAAQFSYAPGDAETRIYSNGSNNKETESLANIGFTYWATDLRTDMGNRVPRFVPDRSTNLDGSGVLAAGLDPMQNKVIYFNPANDVATWQHVVQFMIALGIDGELRYPEDYAALRAGTKDWPKPTNDAPASIDDMWHAAINSRGSYFSAADPTALVAHLSEVISNILSRRGSSTALSATMSVLTQGTQGFTAGYDTSDWSGFLTKRSLDAVTGEPVNTIWEAGCLLTGNGCTSGTTTVTAARAPASRKIFTSANTNKKFEWGSLSSAQKTALMASTESTDDNAQLRLAYLRGDRTNETAAPVMRRRGSVLGAIINAQPVFISGPTGGFSDSFPAGSDEANAVATNSYSKFLYDNRNRAPTVYAGSNDGMLHAFNAVDGTERWAYVPNMLFENGKLLELTDKDNTKIVPGVDDMPVIQDVFFNNKWHTVLVGSMRLGGRGVFALDITDPDNPVVLWEFSNSSTGGDVLGYTYSSANIARLSTGRWVALVSTGYFAKDVLDPTSSDPNREKTSLLVIDLETGVLTQAIPTVSGTTTFGLSAPAIYDGNSDQVDDFAVAGDLAGNLWRFDLRATIPSSWTADLMFKNYTTNPTATAPPKQPISVMPVALRDPAAGTPIWVFGTGKYLGLEDRTAFGTPSNVGPQAFYGIRDNGPGSTTIVVADLVEQTLTQTASGVRSLTQNVVPLANGGWTFKLNPDSKEPGERAVVTALPLYASNRAVLTTLIPKNNDPCSPGRRGAIMVVDAGIGGAPIGDAPLAGELPGVVGMALDSDSISSISPPSLIGQHGGGGILLPGIPAFKIPDPPYHRGAWRELQD